MSRVPLFSPVPAALLLPASSGIKWSLFWPRLVTQRVSAGLSHDCCWTWTRIDPMISGRGMSKQVQEYIAVACRCSLHARESERICTNMSQSFSIYLPEPMTEYYTYVNLQCQNICQSKCKSMNIAHRNACYPICFCATPCVRPDVSVYASLSVRVNVGTPIKTYCQSVGQNKRNASVSTHFKMVSQPTMAQSGQQWLLS